MSEKIYKVISPISQEVGRLVKAKIKADPNLFERIRAAVDLEKPYLRKVLNGTQHTSVRRLEIICKLCDIGLMAFPNGAALGAVTLGSLLQAKPEQKTFGDIPRTPALMPASLTDLARENSNEHQKHIERIEYLEEQFLGLASEHKELQRKFRELVSLQHQTLMALSKHVKEGGHNASIIAA